MMTYRLFNNEEGVKDQDKTFLKRKIQSDYFKKNKSIKSSGFGQDIGNTLFIYFRLISLLSMPSFKITQPKSVD